LIELGFFTAIILISLRLLAFILVVPVFFPKGTPPILKVMFTVILAYIIAPGLGYGNLNNINNNFQLIIYAVSEFTTGLTLGFITSICFDCIRIAGSLIDMNIGLSMLSMFDPNANSNVTFMERLLYWFSLVIFFIVDAHHVLIKALVESFNTVSLGRFIISQNSAMHIVEVFINYFELGLRIAIPIVLIIILTDLTLGLVAKTVPQLNVMILGLPIKILLGLSVISLSLPFFYEIIGVAFNNIPASIRQLYKLLPLVIIFSSDDKTEDPTHHKLTEAKKKGQVAKSKEIGSAITLLTSTIILITLGKTAANSFASNIVEFFGVYLNIQLNDSTLQGIIVTILWRVAIVVLPLAIPIMILGIGGSIMQTGYINSTEPLKPDFSKLNPISGFKKIFSLRSLVDLVKNISVIIIVASVGYSFLKNNFRQVLVVSNLRFSVIVSTIFELITSIFLRITLVIGTIALVDFIYQKYQFKKDMRMTKQEIKEEYKQMEGDPQVKGKIKQRQREMATGRMMQNVPNASVIITNPTHIAIALKYESGKSNAPTLVAKGSGYVAIKIKEIAKEHEIPIIENKPLARLMFDKVDIEDEIPSEMYQAVAEILALVYKMKKRK